MKVIAFNGSPRKDGVSAKGISIMKDELEREGITTEIIQVGDRNIQGCIACRKCAGKGSCAMGKSIFRKDIVQECSEKLKSADGIILACPVYYGGIAGTFKCFLDRLFFPGPNMKYKVGAAVVSLRRTGGIAAFQQLNNYFNLSQMIISPGAYWQVIHGNSQEELLKDEEGCQLLETQARNMAWLIKTLDEGSKTIPHPAPVERKRTNFIR